VVVGSQSSAGNPARIVAVPHWAKTGSPLFAAGNPSFRLPKARCFKQRGPTPNDPDISTAQRVRASVAHDDTGRCQGERGSRGYRRHIAFCEYVCERTP
jgi:hypothetical protein